MELESVPWFKVDKKRFEEIRNRIESLMLDKDYAGSWRSAVYPPVLLL
jgi:hypothetical protein